MGTKPGLNPFIASLLPPDLPEQVQYLVDVQRRQMAALELLAQRATSAPQEAPEPEIQLIHLIVSDTPSYVTSEKLHILGITWYADDTSDVKLYVGENNVAFYLGTPAAARQQSTLDLSGAKRFTVARGQRIWVALTGGAATELHMTLFAIPA